MAAYQRTEMRALTSARLSTFLRKLDDGIPADLLTLFIRRCRFYVANLHVNNVIRFTSRRRQIKFRERVPDEKT